MNSYSINIKNAFSVVYNTLENVKKLMEYCDKVAESNGYYSCTYRFLRYNTDSSVDGWVYNKLFKIYQSAEGELLNNGWRNGPLYDNRIKFSKLDHIYTVGIPKDSYKKTYWGLERVVFRSGDLLEINSDNVNTYIFGEYSKLKEK